MRGCPDKSALANGSCSALIKNRGLAKEIIDTTIKGSGGLPVSVKTRLGYEKYQTEDWVGFLLGFDLTAITVHGRTVKELSKVPANWDEIGKAVKLRNGIKSKTLIVGNGDVLSYSDALQKSEKYGVDGVMIGRGIFHNPYIFSSKEVELREEARLKLMLNHTKLFAETWGDTKNFEIVKKFFKIYISNFPEASELRTKLMACHSFAEVETCLAA